MCRCTRTSTTWTTPCAWAAFRATGRSARYIGGAATLVRLYSGRPVAEATQYELVGAKEEELNLFG